jgi:hypothetical protein
MRGGKGEEGGERGPVEGGHPSGRRVALQGCLPMWALLSGQGYEGLKGGEEG